MFTSIRPGSHLEQQPRLFLEPDDNLHLCGYGKCSRCRWAKRVSGFLASKLQCTNPSSPRYNSDVQPTDGCNQFE